MFGLAACDEGGPSVCQRKRADDHQCETSWGAVAEQMPEHASTRPGQRGQYIREEENEQDHGFAKLLKQWRNS